MALMLLSVLGDLMPMLLKELLLLPRIPNLP
jgi:hypothetical protein